MRYILLLLAALFVIPAVTFAARFDFTSGQPSVVEDTTTSTSRVDFTNGQPSVVFDATGDTPVVPVVVSAPRVVLTSGTLTFGGGTTILP